MGRMSRSVLKARKARSTWARALQEETTPGLSRSLGDAGAQHVDAVQGGFGGDGVLVAGVADAVAGDLDGEVLGDLAAVQHPVGAHGDLVRAAQRGAGPRAGRGDLAQVGFGGGQQAFALAGPLGFQERVHAGHQPLAGEVRGGDLGQVLDIEQGSAAGPRRGPAS